MSPKFLFLFFIVLFSSTKCEDSDLIKYLKSFIQQNLPNEIFIHVVEIFRNQAHTFPDNSKEYLENFNKTIEYGSFNDVTIKAPLIDMNKEDIIEKGNKINAPMELSYSCYTGGKEHCGTCESCKRRKRAFKKANIKDLTKYTR